jgi:pimeloyl-ACP methyl ester carboxylesterase
MAEGADAGQPAHAILVHGAWQGAWVWEAFAPLLQVRGITTEAIDLPGADGRREDAGFDEQVDALVARIDAVPAGVPVLLLAHSGGAVLASQAAEDRAPRIAALVMVAGIMLPSGTSLAAVIASMVAEGHPPEALAGIRPHLLWSADGRVSRVPPQAAVDVFLHDCPPPAAAAAAARLTPQSEAARAGTPRLTEARWGRVPRLYVEALRDRSIVPAVQRRLLALSPGAQVLSIDAGHAPHVSRPVALAALLGPALAEAASRWCADASRRCADAPTGDGT